MALSGPLFHIPSQTLLGGAWVDPPLKDSVTKWPNICPQPLPNLSSKAGDGPSDNRGN